MFKITTEGKGRGKFIRLTFKGIPLFGDKQIMECKQYEKFVFVVTKDGKNYMLDENLNNIFQEYTDRNIVFSFSASSWDENKEVYQIEAHHANYADLGYTAAQEEFEKITGFQMNECYITFNDKTGEISKLQSY